MTRRWLLCLTVLVASPAQAQDCMPMPLIYVYWGSYGAAHIPESTLTTGWVPDTELWWVQDAAASIDVPDGTTLPLADYILLDNTRYTDGTLWYLVALAKATSTNTTPVVMLNRGHWLLPAHRLSVRTNITIPSTVRMGIHATGLKLPAACLSRVLGFERPASAATPDLSALVQAAQAAALALTGLAQSLP